LASSGRNGEIAPRPNIAENAAIKTIKKLPRFTIN
jgi:hypothetical protein